MKWNDVEGNYIHIQRTEIIDYELLDSCKFEYNGTRIVEHTKSSAGDRYVYLSSKARNILKKINETNEQYGYDCDDFIFVHVNGRTVANSVTKCLDKYCARMGIQPKRIHKIRKTYISTLIDNNVSINTIRKQVGHEDEKTTYKSYCFSRLTDSQTENILEKALKEV